MPLVSGYCDPDELVDRLRRAPAVTAELMSEVTDRTCERFRSLQRTEPAARIERLIEGRAWTDAALALIELELRQWQLRRIAYDEGEWHCALSRAREIPDWLDQAIEASHEDLPLALLSAFVEASRVSAPRNRTSVPLVPRHADLPGTPLCCDNFA